MTQSQTSSYSFRSIEQLDEMLHEMDWLTEYRQIKPGQFSSTFTTLEEDSWFMLEEQSSRGVEVLAPAPDGMYVLALAQGEPVVVNGLPFTPGHVYIQGPGSQIRATFPAGVRITELAVPADCFEEVIHSVAPDLPFVCGGATTIETAPARLNDARRAMRSLLHSPPARRATREEAYSRTLADIVAIVAENGGRRSSRNLHRANARRGLNRALEYIEAHLKNAIRVAPMCQYAGTNLRSLERSFERELGMPPQEYIKVRRLNSVRRHLLAADREVEFGVTEVALSHGFVHLGRFAGEYRRLFGEYPRETLKRQ